MSFGPLSYLSLYYQNVRSLRNKNLDFQQGILASVVNFDLITLTETWLDDSILDGDIKPQGYFIFRCDRDFVESRKSRGGGTAILVREDTRCRLGPCSGSGLEVSSVIINTSSVPLIVIVGYLPPCSSLPGPQFCQALTDFTAVLEALVLEHKGAEFVIIGDFNLPGYGGWYADGTQFASGHHPDPRVRETLRGLIVSVNSLGLRQFIDQSNTTGNLLDLCFSSSDQTVVDTMDDYFCRMDAYHPIGIRYPGRLIGIRYPGRLIGIRCSGRELLDTSSWY